MDANVKRFKIFYSILAQNNKIIKRFCKESKKQTAYCPHKLPPQYKY